MAAAECPVSVGPEYGWPGELEALRLAVGEAEAAVGCRWRHRRRAVLGQRPG